MEKENLVSPDEEQWLDIARAIRGHLLQRCGKLWECGPGDLKTFIETCQAAFWLEENAATFDKDVELKNARIVHSD